MLPNEIARLAELLLLHYRLSNEARQYRSAMKLFTQDSAEDIDKDKAYVAYLEDKCSEVASEYLTGIESRTEIDKVEIFRYVARKISTHTPAGSTMEALLVLNS